MAQTSSQTPLSFSHIGLHQTHFYLSSMHFLAFICINPLCELKWEKIKQSRDWLNPVVSRTNIDLRCFRLEKIEKTTILRLNRWHPVETLPQRSESCTNTLSTLLICAEIKCMGTGQFSSLSSIALSITWLHYWVLSVVDAKKIRHHKMQAGF